jgi:hypothetical protein
MRGTFLGTKPRAGGKGLRPYDIDNVLCIIGKDIGILLSGTIIDYSVNLFLYEKVYNYDPIDTVYVFRSRLWNVVPDEMTIPL